MNLYLSNMERMIKQFETVINALEKQRLVMESFVNEIKKNNQLLDRIQISTNRIANDGGF